MIRFIRKSHIIFLIGDLLVLNLALLLTFNIYHVPDSSYLLSFIWVNTIWVFISLIFRLYAISRLSGYIDITIKMAKSVGWHLVILSICIVLLKETLYSQHQLVLFYIVFTLLLLVWRVSLSYLLKIYRKLGFNTCNVVIVGYNQMGKNLYHFFQSHPGKGYNFKGFFDNKVKNELVKGEVKDLKEFSIKNDVHEIYCSPKYFSQYDISELKNFADNHFKRLKLIASTEGILSALPFKLEQYGSTPVLSIRKEPLNDIINKIIKRTFDIAFSFLVITLILSWLIPLIAIFIKIDSKGPIFFLQKRAGKNNTIFWCFKFRTMKYIKDAEYIQATKNDKRITRIGAFLRKTNLDELPQFFNVLIGDMTVVGPRPHPLELNENFKNHIQKYMARHLVKPGVTGLAQIKGYRGETKEVKAMANRVKMDLFYIENWSFILDLKIIVLTLFSMIRGDKNAF